MYKPPIFGRIFALEATRFHTLAKSRLALLAQSVAAIALNQALFASKALAQPFDFDQVISTDRSSTVVLSKPGTTVHVESGVTVSVPGSSGNGMVGPSGTWIITNDGSIEAPGMAIALYGPGSGVINNNLISGGYGIRSFSDLTVRNNAGGVIHSTNGAGVIAARSLTLDNAGTISGYTAVGGYLQNGSFGADITNSGVINGIFNGISVTGSASQSSTNTIRNLNEGQILATAPSGYAVYLLHGMSTIVNDTDAIILGGRFGIHGGDLYTFFDVDNAGRIEGAAGTGIYSYGGGKIENQAGAEVVGLGGVAYVRSIYGEVNLKNAGSIRGTATSFTGGNGTDAGNGAGVYVGGTTGFGTIDNLTTGLIQGGAYGIYAGPALLAGDAGPMLITNAGEITGATGISVNGALANIHNYGTITGTDGTAISFEQTGAHDNTLTLDTGSVLNGAVLGGAGHDALNLYGNGSEDISKFQNFERLTMHGSNWALSGNGNFSAGTNVYDGHLEVNGTLTTPTVDVSYGSSLGGNGTVVGDLTNEGQLSPGTSSSAGALTIDGDLALTGSSVLNYQLGEAGMAGGALNDLINVSGDLRLGGTLNVSSSLGSVFGAGVYRIINYGGSLTDNGLALGDMPAGSTNTIQTSIGGQVNLINTTGPALSFWDGNAGPKGNGVIDGGDGSWQGSGGNNNWTEASGALNGSYSEGSYAVFAGKAGAVTVDNGFGNVAVAGMQFASDGYKIESGQVTLLSGEASIRVGDGSQEAAGFAAEIASELTGTGSLAKTDAGTLILSGANTYTGGTSIKGGILQVSSDANLGISTGGLTFEGGALRTTSSFDTSRAFSLLSTALVEVADAATLGLSGAVTGPGDLLKDGSGTLILGGQNSYGNTLIQTGTLIGNAGSISGDVGNASTLVFDQSANGRFAGNIVGLSDLKGTVVKTGIGSLVLEGTSTLDWTIDDGKIVSEAERFGGNVEIASSGTMSFDQTENAVYSGTISGKGTFEKTGAGATVLSGDSSAFGGLTAINAGTLFVDGKLGGTLGVADSGTLAGNGTVGSTVVEAGGTLSPGKALPGLTANGDSAMGILTVQGDLTFKDGSTFAVDMSLETADRVDVVGQANIAGGAVSVQKAAGVYLPGTRWTILNASDGVAGSFTSITENLPYVGLTLGYDVNNVYLDIKRNDTAFCLSEFTFNECSTANGAESLGERNALYDVIASQGDGASAAYAFDQLSGEIHASARTAMIDDSRYVREAMNDRLRGAFGSVGGVPAQGYGGSAPTPSFAPSGWMQGFGAKRTFASDGNAARMSQSSGGFFTGFDGAIGENWRVGVLGGYSRTNFAVDGRFSSGTIDNYHVGAYAGTQWRNLSLRTGAAYTRHDISTNRSVVFPGFADRLTTHYSGQTAQIFGELGYRIHLGETALGNVLLEPFANLAHVHVASADFNEQGGIAALSGKTGSFDQTFTTVGLRGQTDFELDNGTKVTARGAVGWRRAAKKAPPQAKLNFASGAVFDIAGVPMARDSLVLEAGFDAKVSKSMTIGTSYVGQISGSQKAHGFKASLSWKF